MSESVCPKCGAEQRSPNAAYRGWTCASEPHRTTDGGEVIEQSSHCRVRELTNTVAQQAEEIVRLKEEREGQYGPVINALHAAILNDCEVRVVRDGINGESFQIAVSRIAGDKRTVSSRHLSIGLLHDARTPQFMFAEAIRAPLLEVIDPSTPGAAGKE